VVLNNIGINIKLGSKFDLGSTKLIW